MCDGFEREASGAAAKSADRRRHDGHCEGDELEYRIDPAQIEQKRDDEPRQRRRQPAPGLDKADRARADARREHSD